MSGEAIKRQDSLIFLDVSENGTADWAWINEGVEEFGVEFNEDVERRHYIGNKNSSASSGSQEKGTSVTQFAHKGDKVFDYIDDIMYYERQGAEATTDLLEVFVYRSTDGKTDIPAKKSRVLITKGSHGGGGGEDLAIEYGIEFIGDPEFVKVTLAEDKTITVTPEV